MLVKLTYLLFITEFSNLFSTQPTHFFLQIEQYFYCEHCNYAVEGFANIKSHTETETHKNNKTNPENFPKRLQGRYIDTESVVINDYKVSTLQWHGMIHKRCGFCESIVQNVAEHMTMRGHVVKLIQSVLHCEDDNNKIYRKVCCRIFNNLCNFFN